MVLPQKIVVDVERIMLNRGAEQMKVGGDQSMVKKNEVMRTGGGVEMREIEEELKLKVGTPLTVDMETLIDLDIMEVLEKREETGIDILTVVGNEMMTEAGTKRSPGVEIEIEIEGVIGLVIDSACCISAL